MFSYKKKYNTKRNLSFFVLYFFLCELFLMKLVLENDCCLNTNTRIFHTIILIKTIILILYEKIYKTMDCVKINIKTDFSKKNVLNVLNVYEKIIFKISILVTRFL